MALTEGLQEVAVVERRLVYWDGQGKNSCRSGGQECQLLSVEWRIIGVDVGYCASLDVTDARGIFGVVVPY